MILAGLGNSPGPRPPPLTDLPRLDLSQPRRAALGMLAGVAALATGAAPSFAAYGDSANVFGKVTNKSGEQSGPIGPRDLLH